MSGNYIQLDNLEINDENVSPKSSLNNNIFTTSIENKFNEMTPQSDKECSIVSENSPDSGFIENEKVPAIRVQEKITSDKLVESEEEPWKEVKIYSQNERKWRQ